MIPDYVSIPIMALLLGWTVTATLSWFATEKMLTESNRRVNSNAQVADHWKSMYYDLAHKVYKIGKKARND